ncbi:dimethylsulfonioproprionate lyase DddP [Vibrio harveyi]|uniref:dimethylsulfonioproprionate lyase DddP n=1 Tax=Vibrio TaxID=662 RepID=UPI0005F05404|nr:MULTISPECIES: dimethylsulfonioproprionate lyase DddP [Vibrio]EKO3808333.1 aminopeptidase P family protein [Vibrio harveyi]EKO3843381.1 aminopeptidase P family protein [Vibrio harveyi]EKY4196949.1 aminopeptidase P family protein [Vibrio harveyi]ELC3157686.1 aminopeptidase P family protein [Vibrio harveyi]MCG9623254.1 Xaa-Pro peptidase family protein [Vibrio mediterranei]
MTNQFVLGSNRKIDPSRRRAAQLKPDGSVNDNDRVEIGPTALAFQEWADLGLTPPNLHKMREYRLKRIVDQLQARDLAGVLLFDPLNIRYATDSTNMQLWIAHNHARACFVSAEGYMILWDFHNCEHLSAHLPLVKEVRNGASFFYFETGNRTNEHAHHFAKEIADIVKRHGGGSNRIAVDKIEIVGLRELDKQGLDIFDGQEVMELARAVKNIDEINAMRCSIASTEIAMKKMQEATVPGVTENDIWSVLHAENIKRGGEWIECRILSSGPRTNPWFQECGPRVVKEGELLAFDTDLIGPYGFCADLSRTWLIGDVEATEEQRHLYRVAYEHIQHNMEILKPGMTFEEVTRSGLLLPEKYRPQRYGVMMHGVGLCDEYPSIRYPEDLEGHGYDGVLEPGMALCVEAYVGAVGGKEGVKLEDQVIITEDGFENLTNYPFEKELLK